ncbi:MAG: CvpA family protein [Clostridia bacterium]|jgi:uncharacterized membrane protein required for colicin V production|nr:CvpA family protein [Clostridia bacterium]
MNFIDLIVIAVLVFNALIDYKRGFIVSFYRATSMGISLFTASKLYPVISNVLKKTQFYNNVEANLSANISVNEIVNSQTVDTPLPDIVDNMVMEAVKNGTANIKTMLVGELTEFVIKIVSMAIVVVVVSVGLKIVVYMLDLISKLPVLNFFNKNLGLAFGLIVGVFQLWVAGTVLTYLAINQKYAWLYEAVESSKLGNYFYNNNILLNVVTGIFK